MLPLQPAFECAGLRTEGGDGAAEMGTFYWIKVGDLELGCEGVESCLFGARKVFW